MRRDMSSISISRSLSPVVFYFPKTLLLIETAMLLMGISSAAWALNAKPLDYSWVPDNYVDAVARSGNTIYIGGNFTHVGPQTGAAVALDTTTQLPVGAYPVVTSGSIYAGAPDGSGGWYIGGSFSKVGGLTRNNIAHVKSDGTVDPNWNPDADGVVWTIAVSGATVYVGGAFTTIGGQARSSIAALNSTATGTATSWNPGANSDVYTLAVSGATVYAGGDFTTIGGQARKYIAALDATVDTNSATAWNPAAGSDVASLAVSGTTVYAGGYFTTIGGQTRKYIAALDATLNTNNATDWDPSANNAVYVLAVSGATVYAGGYFTSIGGQARNYLAALDATVNTHNATSWNPSPDTNVWALAVSGATVYAGGDFTTIGGHARNYLAALSASTGTVTDWDLNATATVESLTASGSRLYVGTDSAAFIGCETRNHVAAIDAMTGIPTSWNPNANANVDALAVSGTTVYIGGLFTSVGGQARSYIAALDATSTGTAIAWNPSMHGEVHSLAVSTADASTTPTVYAGLWNGGVHAIDATTGSIIGNNSSAGGIALALSGTTLYAGGWDYKLTAMDTTNGLATQWAIAADNRIDSLGLADWGTSKTLYVGGTFTTFDGQTRDKLAAVDAKSGALLDWNPDVAPTTQDTSEDSHVMAMAVAQADSGTTPTLYIGGRFDMIGGLTRTNLAAIDGLTGAVGNWDPETDPPGYGMALSAYGSTVCAGGEFATIGGQSHPCVALFTNAPVVTGASARTTNTRPTWTWTSCGGVGTFRYQLVDDPATGWTTTTATSYAPSAPLRAGTYTLHVEELDNTGAWSDPGSFTITIYVTAAQDWLDYR
jgi:hypothetical protein